MFKKTHLVYDGLYPESGGPPIPSFSPLRPRGDQGRRRRRRRRRTEERLPHTDRVGGFLENPLNIQMLSDRYLSWRSIDMLELLTAGSRDLFEEFLRVHRIRCVNTRRRVMPPVTSISIKIVYESRRSCDLYCLSFGYEVVCMRTPRALNGHRSSENTLGHFSWDCVVDDEGM